MDIIDMETLAFHVNIEVGTVPTLEAIHQGLATTQDIQDLEAKLPDITGFATTKNFQDLEQKLPKMDNLATSLDVRNLEQKLPNITGLATSLAEACRGFSGAAGGAVDRKERQSPETLQKKFTSRRMHKGLLATLDRGALTPSKIPPAVFQGLIPQTALNDTPLPAYNQIDSRGQAALYSGEDLLNVPVNT
ncbi:hypothetical protein KCV07_g3161, partial [Aureobasidium melanogenum]